MKNAFPKAIDFIKAKKVFFIICAVVFVLIVAATMALLINNSHKKTSGEFISGPKVGGPSSDKPVEEKMDETPPVIKNLMVDFGKYSSATGRAGAFVFKSSEDKVFYEFGAKVTGPEGTKMLPTFEYRTDPNAPVYAVADGVVIEVKFQKETQDYEILTKKSKKSIYMLVYDHVKNISLKTDDAIVAGQTMGTVGTWREGMGRTELMVIKIGGSGGNEDYCPFRFFDPALITEYKQKVSSLMKDWESFKENTAIYDEAKDIWPGCPYERLIEDKAGVRVP